MFDDAPGGGLQVLWRPTAWLSILGNQYRGTARPSGTQAHPHRQQRHGAVLQQADRSLLQGGRLAHAPCEWGGEGALDADGKSQYFLGFTAFSGTPYFTAAPGEPYGTWDVQFTGDYMPREFVTFRGEFNHRRASVPYFSG
jgi:hypothetical protein